MQFPFFRSHSHVQIYTLLISKKTVGACVWHVEGDRILVDGISNLVLWDEEQEDSLFAAADTVIGSFGDISATQVLLSLPDDWVQGQSIHPRRRGTLRSLTDKLELTSVGFVVTIEAVIAHQKEQATTPLHCVSVAIDPDAVIMAIITQSQSSPIMRIGRSDRVSDDFLEGCSRLKMTNVPPQMVLFSLFESEQSLAEIKHQLETYTWDPNIFIQSPTIKLESPAFVLTAVSQAGGREVLKSLPELAGEVGEKSKEVVPAPDFTPVTAELDSRQKSAQSMPVQLDAHSDPEDIAVIQPKKHTTVFLLLGIGILAAVVIGYFLLLPRFLRVQVVIKQRSTTVSGSTQLLLRAETDTATTSAWVRAATLPLSVSGELEIATTGQKKTGDPAVGSVAVFNLTSASKTFKAGTALKTGKLSFETSEEVTIASASSGQNYEKIPGKAIVKARASAVGEEGNIGKNVELSIGGFDTSAFVARTENPFSGGTSRSVSAVAAKDLETVSSALNATLKKKLESEFEGKLDSGQDGFISGEMTTSQKKYSHAIGDESGSLSLSQSASGSAIVYSRLDALEAAANALDANIPPGAKLDAQAISVERTAVKKLAQNEALIDVTVSGDIKLPVDARQFASLLAGKTTSEAMSFLQDQSAVESYTLKIFPSYISWMIRTLPKQPENVVIEIQ